MNAPMDQRLQMRLEDRYLVEQGWVYMTGMQALVRLPLQQRMRDAARGLNTGGYISGYRGSPLGRYDIELWQAGDLLKAQNIVFRPGVNEDLAATAIWGAQYVGIQAAARVDGVFGIWYGKGPGVDRSGDPLRHANLAGTSPHGGVLALAGDDHGAKSSTVANFSDLNFVANGIPLLYPANAQEVLDLGLHGIAMSRYSGCWSGMKLVTDVVEGGGSVWVAPDSPDIIVPDEPPTSPDGVHVRGGFDTAMPQEARLYHHKLYAALAYARANGPGRIVHASPGARVGIVAAGKAWQDVQRRWSPWGSMPSAPPPGRTQPEGGPGQPLDAMIVRPEVRSRWTRSSWSRKSAPCSGPDPIGALRHRSGPTSSGKRWPDSPDPARRGRVPERRRDRSQPGRARAGRSATRGARLASEYPRRRFPSPQASCRRVPSFAPAVHTGARPSCRTAAVRWRVSAATRWRCCQSSQDDGHVAYGRRGSVARAAAIHRRSVFANLGDSTLFPLGLSGHSRGRRRPCADHLAAADGRCR
ncbi:MAG: hypothetical protein R3E48_06775 [Burkholderiaceae bacterium]